MMFIHSFVFDRHTLVFRYLCILICLPESVHVLALTDTSRQWIANSGDRSEMRHWFMQIQMENFPLINSDRKIKQRGGGLGVEGTDRVSPRQSSACVRPVDRSIVVG